MKGQPNRLPADAARGFGGSAIDRKIPLTFQLNGRQFSGFAGDTILSALLAAGVDTSGEHLEAPIGLVPGATPAVYPAAHRGDPAHAAPMDAMPAINGAELVTLGGARLNPIARLFGTSRTLGLSLDQPNLLDEPWRALPAQAAKNADIVVVGGGVAGMSAALAAARLGQRVILVEASPQLGGHSGLFGTQDGEDAPEVSIAKLREAVAATKTITALTRTRAYAIRTGLLRVHTIENAETSPRPAVLDIAAKHIIIATGARERLPIFSGNRLPGVIGSLSAYELATRYGVWAGRSALVATGSNFAYRLAMLASDAGITLPRVIDNRPGPSSRFIEFSRAYGMIQQPGALITGVEATKTGLAVSTDREHAEPLQTQRLIVCGGWQPDLTLWHIAGGASVWNHERHRLEPAGQIEGIILAGSAAGYLTRRGCIASGVDAVNALLGRQRKPVDDHVIDPIYESPDAPTAIAPPRDGAPAYLDSGAEFLTRPQPAPKTFLGLFKRKKAGLTALSEAPQPLAINDVAAGVNLGLIPPEAAGVVAHERVALVALGAPAETKPDTEETPPAPTDVPPYLNGRFGPDAVVARIALAEQRRLEAGALIFDSPDADGPFAAVGVILRPHENGAMALLAPAVAAQGCKVSIRDQGQPVPGRVELLYV